MLVDELQNFSEELSLHMGTVGEMVELTVALLGLLCDVAPGHAGAFNGAEEDAFQMLLEC